MKMFRLAAAGAATLLLSACLLTPGKFDAALDIRRDGTFSYSYQGEMVLLTGQGLAQLAAKDAAAAEFDPDAEVCWNDEADELETRDCTEEEIEAAREAWEAGRAARAEEKAGEAAMVKAMLGGIDPNDPGTMDEFARRLSEYEGWERVAHKGDGVFEVDYRISGRLGHDFVFPVLPTIDYAFPFVQVARRDGGKVRIVAPAFVEGSAGGKESSMWAAALQGVGQTGDANAIPRPDGRFTLTTDAEILTNNTGDGPVARDGAKVLTWTVGPLDNSKPEALLQL